MKLLRRMDLLVVDIAKAYEAKRAREKAKLEHFDPFVQQVQHRVPYTPFARLLCGDTMLITLAFDLSCSMKQSMDKGKAPSPGSRADAVTNAVANMFSFQDMLVGKLGLLEVPKAKVVAYGFGFSQGEEVRDLLNINNLPNSTATPLEVLIRDRQAYREHFETLKPIMFGDTPMTQALLTVRERVLREIPSDISSVTLFIVSDGEPTDARSEVVMELAAQMRREGIYIISGFITSTDLPNPKVLVSKANPSWPETALTMFNIASELPDNLAGEFHKFGWHAEGGCRLFAQINQSELLGEFMNTMLYLLINKGK